MTDFNKSTVGLRIGIILMLILVFVVLIVLCYTISRRGLDANGKREPRKRNYAKERKTDSRRRTRHEKPANAVRTANGVKKRDTNISIGGKNYKVRDADQINISIPDNMDVTMNSDLVTVQTDMARERVF